MTSPPGSRGSALVGLSTASWKGADPSKPQDDSVSKGKKVDWDDVEARARMEAMRLIRWRKEQGAILPPTPCRSRQPPKKRRREHGARQEEDITAPVAKAPRCELGVSGDPFAVAGPPAMVPEARAGGIPSDESASSSADEDEAEAVPDAEELGASPMRVDPSPGLCPEMDSTTVERKAEPNELEGAAGSGSPAGQHLEVEHKAGYEHGGAAECGGGVRLEETERRSSEGDAGEMERCAVLGPGLEIEQGGEARESAGAAGGKADDVTGFSAAREESIETGQPIPGEECDGILPCATRGASEEMEQKRARDGETCVTAPCDMQGGLEDTDQCAAAGEAVDSTGPCAPGAEPQGTEHGPARGESEEPGSCTTGRDVGEMEPGTVLSGLEETGQGAAGEDANRMEPFAPGVEVEATPQRAVGQGVEKPDSCAFGLEGAAKKPSDVGGGLQEAEQGASDPEALSCARPVGVRTSEDKEVSAGGERAKVEPAGGSDSTDALDACVGFASRPISLPAGMLGDGSAVHDEHLSTPFPSPAYLEDGGRSGTPVWHCTPRTVSTMPPSPPVSDLTDSLETPCGFATESLCDRHEPPYEADGDGDSDALDLLARLALKRTASDASSSGSEMATADPMRLLSALAARCSIAHVVHGDFLEDRGNEDGEKAEVEQWRGLGADDEEGATSPCLELPQTVDGGQTKDSHPEEAVAPESDSALDAATRRLSFLSQAAAAATAAPPEGLPPISGGVMIQGQTPWTPAVPESLDEGHNATPIVCPASASELGVQAFRESGLLPDVPGNRCPPSATGRHPSSSELTAASALSALFFPTEGGLDATPSKADDGSTSLGPPAGSRMTNDVSDGVGVAHPESPGLPNERATSAAGDMFVNCHRDVIGDASSTATCTDEAPRRIYLPPIPRLPGFSGIGANATRWSYESSGWMRSPYSQWWRPAKGLCALLEAGVLCEAEGFTRRLTMSLAESSAVRLGRSYGEAGIGPGIVFAVGNVRIVRRRAPRRKRETHVLVADDDLKEGANSVWRGLEEAAKAEAKALLSARKSGLLEAETEDNRHWVRRSVRAAGSSALDSPNVVKVLEMIRSNHPEVEVLKLHHYLSADVNSGVIEAVLDALMTNENCQALYIQDFNEGIRDEQVRKLAQVLRRGNIWCLNAGENYKVSIETWWFFVEEVKETNVTHAYLSEHVITPELKNGMRDAIRANRAKHTRHKSFDNLDVIRRCTNMWWNPINSRELQAEMKRRNVSYEELIPCVPAGSILSRVPCSLHDGKEVPSYSVPSPDFPALPPAAGLQPL